MATKTISVDLDAYARLCAARERPGESFSQVIKRARWEGSAHTGRAFLEAMRGLPALDEATLAALDAAHGADRPPEDKWRGA